MNKQDFRLKLKELSELGRKYKWNLLGCDSQNYRISLQDEMRIFRMDIYVSTGTVVFGRVGLGSSTTKNNTTAAIEKLLKNPYQ